MIANLADGGWYKPVAKQESGDDSPVTGAAGASAEREHRDDADDPVVKRQTGETDEFWGIL